MAKLLFLRGKLPLDFRPDRLQYDHISQCEDMWTVLCERLSRGFDKTELWYYGAGKNQKTRHITEKFTERWIELSDLPDFKPDVIFARGGFQEYLPVCDKFPDAYKIYYGAGIRYKPQEGKWDLVLVDSLAQQQQVPGSKLFVKPAADNIFRPVDTNIKYDVCFMANAPQAHLKRHKLAFESLAGTGISILHLGLVDGRLRKWAKNTNVTFGGWHRRPLLPEFISQCRIGLVCCTDYDSCPRVLPEYLACGLPVVATSNMHFWHDKYITKDTGLLCEDDQIRQSIEQLLSNPPATGDVLAYYNKYLSLDAASRRLIQ